MNEKAKVIFNEFYKKQKGEKLKSLSERFFSKICGKLLYTDYYDLNNSLYVEMSQGEDGNYRDIFCVFVVQNKRGRYSKRGDLQKSFRTVEDARDYMKELERK
ncbi:MAG: hypothetical protein FXF54_01260 [Kosmotoga sp.]|nr:MAG: hypothetical protein FXF54_01260 [Kosmotoga sp.]